MRSSSFRRWKRGLGAETFDGSTLDDCAGFFGFMAPPWGRRDADRDVEGRRTRRRGPWDNRPSTERRAQLRGAGLRCDAFGRGVAEDAARDVVPLAGLGVGHRDVPGLRARWKAGS